MAGSKRQKKINSLTARPGNAFNVEAMNMAQNANIKLVVDRWEGTRVARRHFSVFDQLATNGKTVGTVIYPPTLTKNQAVAGNNMFALYAAWKGMAGVVDDDDIGYVQCGRSEPELLTDRMKLCGEEWVYITTGVKMRNGERVKFRDGMDPLNVKLLTAICDDMLLADGSMIYTERAPMPDEDGNRPKTEAVAVTLSRSTFDPITGLKSGVEGYEVQRAKVVTSGPVVRWRKVVEKVCGIKDRDCQRDAIKRMCVDLDKIVTN